MTPACEAARAALPDLLEGPAGAEAVAHVRECQDCARELGALRQALEAATELRHDPLGDPGEAYWDGFGAAVRRRLEARGEEAREAAAGRNRGLRGMAAAAILAGAVAVPLWWSPSPSSPSPAVVTEAALGEALRAATREGGPGVEALGLDGSFADPVSDIVPEVGPGRVLEALRDTESPAGLLGLWDDEEFEGAVRRLDAGGAARLIEEIRRTRG
jgi:hypothetical protein